MKKFTILFVMLMAGLMVHGQYYYIPHINANQNPGALNTDDEYPVGGGIPAGWNTIQAPSANAVWSATQTIPFTFQFNGHGETSYKVSTSGVLTFDVATTLPAPSYNNVALPNAAIPDKSICIWGVAGTGTNDNIVAKTFGVSPNQQYWITFNSYTGDVGSTGWQYWSIVFEETTNKIYIVDQRFYGTAPTNTVGIQVDATTAFSIASSPNTPCNAGNDPTPIDNTYYEFIPGTQSQYDFWTKTIDLYPTQALTAAPFTISGDLTNLGSQAITTFDLNYTVNGGAPVVDHVTGASIASLADYTYSHATAWNPGAVGTYTLKVWCSALNGNADENHANDTVTKVITVVPQLVQRLVLHEGFTSSTCPPCVQGNVNLGNVFAANPNKFTCIKYQMSWPSPGDPYFTDEGEIRRNFYAVNSVPQLWVDGGLGINSQLYTSTQLNAAYAVPSLINLTASALVQYTHAVTITGTIAPVANITSNNLVLHTAIFEYVTHQNVGSNGETTFHYVMKKMVPDAYGTDLAPLTSGTNVPINLSYTFQGNYRLPDDAGDPINNATENSVEEFSDLGVVLWIQDSQTKEVFQSAFATITIGTDEIGDPNGIVGIFPNPANTETNIHYYMQEDNNVTLELYNLMGQKVYSQDYGKMASGSTILTADTRDLAGGLYVVQLRMGEKVYTTKVNVNH